MSENPRWSCTTCGTSNSYWADYCKCGLTHVQANKDKVSTSECKRCKELEKECADLRKFSEMLNDEVNHYDGELTKLKDKLRKAVDTMHENSADGHWIWKECIEMIEEVL